MVLIKSDGYPTYNFANVVDDHLMGSPMWYPRQRVSVLFSNYNRLYDAWLGEFRFTYTAR